MSEPTVSVLIDTCNHASFIRDAISSVLEQDIGRRELEVIVVDDGSTDGTPSVVEPFSGDVRLIRKPNGGQASAFNVGLPLTSGRVVALLDGDDWWAPNKLRSVIEAFELDGDLGAVGHGYVMRFGGSHTDETVLPRALELRLMAEADVVQFVGNKAFLGSGKISFRRDLLARILPIPEQLTVEADEWIFTLAPAMARAQLLPQPFLQYRQHAGNLFMIQDPDPVRTGRKRSALEFLWRALPARLERLGVARDVALAATLPIRVDAERLRLASGAGGRRDTLRVERDAAMVRAWLQEDTSPLVSAASRALAAALPPSRYYQVRDWYGRTRSG
jgi:glycosyltransferase involved in cell wall biosynthesis